jgi:hypothetical protein
MTQRHLRLARLKSLKGNASRIRAFPFCLIVLSLVIPEVVSAAELRGRIWEKSTNSAPSNSSLELNCGQDKFTTPLGSNGSYSIRNVPSRATCILTVKIGERSASRAIPVNGPVVEFYAEIRVVDSQLFLIPR